MVRVALVTEVFSIGGGIEHLYQICKGLPDIQFGVFAKDGYAKQKFKSLKNVKIFTSYNKNSIESFNPDIIHIHHLKPLLKLYNINRKILFTVHGIHLYKYEFMPGIKAKTLRFLRLNLERFLYKRVDKIITVSNSDKKFLKEIYNEDSEVIHNGIDYKIIEKISLSKEKLREELNIPQDKQVYLTVARFDFQKGYDILVKAIKTLKKRGAISNKIFLFIGDGKEIKEIKDMVKDFYLNDYIIFLGVKYNVYEYMKASDYLVLPSRWEGLPITLIEAYFAGLPQIVSNTYGNLEIGRIIGSIFFNNLDFVDLADKIEYVELQNKNYYLDMYMNKQEIKKLFSIETMTRKLKSVYIKLLS